MKNDPLISVILPVYGVEAYLPRCLDSLLAQGYENWEIVAVDDGSPDRCGDILEEYAARDGRIRVIHRENGGVARARNTGLDAARGDCIAFVDPDDWVEPDFLQHLLDAMLREGADIAACGSWNHIGEKVIPDLRDPAIFGPKEGLERMCYNDGFYVTLWDKLYKKDLWDGIRCPEGRLFEDTGTTFRVVDRADRIVATGAGKYHYISVPDSITTCHWNPAKVDYIPAGEDMASYIETKYPDLKRGCDRKRLHVAFSTLMQLVNSGVRDRAVERELTAQIKSLRRGVFTDPKAPRRDKVAILSLALGFPVFAMAWKLYRKIWK